MVLISNFELAAALEGSGTNAHWREVDWQATLRFRTPTSAYPIANFHCHM